jgi:hypothetical protein
LACWSQYGVIELVRSGAVAVMRGPHALSEKVIGSEDHRALTDPHNDEEECTRSAFPLHILGNISLGNILPMELPQSGQQRLSHFMLA